MPNVSLTVSATAQAVGAYSAGTAIGAAKAANRTFSLTGTKGTTFLLGDIVEIGCSNDGGTTFQPLVGPDGGPVQLTFGLSEVIINDSSTHYACRRVQVATGSALAAVGVNGDQAQVNVQANNTSGQSIADGAAAAIVTNWTEVTDSASAFVPTTGIFTAPVGGFYNIHAEVEFAAIAAALASEYTIEVFKTGVLFAAGVYECPVAALSVKRQIAVSCGVQLVAGDTIDIRVSQASGGGLADTLTAVASRNLLSISKVMG